MPQTLNHRRIYRGRVKRSLCRKLRGRTCNKRETCKYANGRKRSFCRSKKNQRVVIPKRWRD